MSITQNPHRSIAILKDSNTGATITKGHAIAKIWGSLACAVGCVVMFSIVTSTGSIVALVICLAMFVSIIPLLKVGLGELLKINRHQVDLDKAAKDQLEAEIALLGQTAHGTAQVDRGHVLAASDMQGGGFVIDIPAGKDRAP